MVTNILYINKKWRFNIKLRKIKMDVVMADAMDDGLFILEVDASVSCGGGNVETLVLKGAPLGDAVLCTPTSTLRPSA